MTPDPTQSSCDPSARISSRRTAEVGQNRLQSRTRCQGRNHLLSLTRCQGRSRLQSPTRDRNRLLNPTSLRRSLFRNPTKSQVYCNKDTSRWDRCIPIPRSAFVLQNLATRSSSLNMGSRRCPPLRPVLRVLRVRPDPRDRRDRRGRQENRKRLKRRKRR